MFGWNVNTVPEMSYTILGTTPSNDEGRPTEVGEMGFAAYFSDTEGNTMGLWQAT